MDRLHIPTDGWVLVCDGAKALILRNDGTSQALHLAVVDVAEQKLAMAHELGTDRPGRIHASQGHASQGHASQGAARSSAEQTDYHEAGEVDFLHTTADTLDALVMSQGVTSLVIVAPPKALGILRKRFTPALKAVIVAELGKDLVRHSTSDIEKLLSA